MVVGTGSRTFCRWVASLSILIFLQMCLDVTVKHLGSAEQVLHSVAKKKGVSISNVAARWVLDKPAVPAIILGARNANHVADHQKLFSFTLDGDNKQRIGAVLASGRQSHEDCYTYERGGDW